jgi:hypothetical protein
MFQKEFGHLLLDLEHLQEPRVFLNRAGILRKNYEEREREIKGT